jgi:hypothetical protein
MEAIAKSENQGPIRIVADLDLELRRNALDDDRRPHAMEVHSQTSRPPDVDEHGGQHPEVGNGADHQEPRLEHPDRQRQAGESENQEATTGRHRGQ